MKARLSGDRHLMLILPRPINKTVRSVCIGTQDDIFRRQAVTVNPMFMSGWREGSCPKSEGSRSVW